MGRKRKSVDEGLFAPAQKELLKYLKERLDQPSAKQDNLKYCAGLPELGNYVEPQKFCVWFKDLEGRQELPEAPEEFALKCERKKLQPHSTARQHFRCTACEAAQQKHKNSQRVSCQTRVLSKLSRSFSGPLLLLA